MFETQSSYRALIISFILTTVIVAGGGYYFYQKSQPQTKAVTIPKTSKKAQTAQAANLPKTPTIPEVLTELFGVKSNADKISNAPDQLSSLWFAQTFKQKQDTFHAFFIKTQTIDPKTKAIFDSHADAPTISVTVYKQAGRQWQLYSKQINIGSFGSWGNVPDIDTAKTLQLSTDNLVFLIEGGFSGQGYTEVGDELFSYNAKSKKWKDLGFVQTGGDNAGACDDQPKQGNSLLSPCWSFTGEITLAKSNKNPAFPDLLVVHKGTTSDDNNKIVPMKNRLYIFNGEQYVEDETGVH